uniref:Uncharacterized protein n=1 Tax=Candidatus Kentrum sp. DK TaxID=2126562 RepID=A0A450S277_9GAMM|nr:MAG: hypothetical protein BECKDK2373B_GA0170837_10117 [Candidatus Kentron sp. DK]
MFGVGWRAIAVSRKFMGSSMPSLASGSRQSAWRDDGIDEFSLRRLNIAHHVIPAVQPGPSARDGNRVWLWLRRARSLSDLGVRREGKRDRDQNLCKFEANSELFNENLRGFWPISAFPQQNHPKSDRLLGGRT